MEKIKLGNKIKFWGDKPYLSLNYYFKNKFYDKVFKISIDGGFSCPNRDGKISNGGCIFCSEKGSGDYAGLRENSIVEQFEDISKKMKKKWNKGKYIMYFQAYTNTYAEVEELRDKYYNAINVNENVIGIAIATRPDCIKDDVLNLLNEINKKTFLWVEFGLQTIHSNTSKYINRGYDLDVFEESFNKLKKRNIKVVVHQILGLPGETKEDMYETTKYLSKIGIWGIKFHLLYVLKDTKLNEKYENQEFKTLEWEEYVKIISKCICLLPENIVIHRITGDPPRELLVSPMWSLKKWEVLNSIHNYMERKSYYQGLYYSTNN